MRTRTITLATTLATLLVAGAAAAQPTTPETTAPEPNPAPDPPPPPPPPTPPPTFVETKQPPAPMTEPVDDHRPTGMSVGIGFGYELPTSLETPNTTSVRFRLPSGLTFEPRLALTSTTEAVDTGEKVEIKETQLAIGALVRYPVILRGRVDLEALGEVFVRNVATDPPEDDNKLTVTTFTASYGLGVSAWLTSHWQVSMSALNPIVESVKNAQEMGFMTKTVTTKTTLGLVFEPSVIFMVHLYN